MTTSNTPAEGEGLARAEAAIERAMNHEYNPFEPDNQTATYRRLEAALSALRSNEAAVAEAVEAERERCARIAESVRHTGFGVPDVRKAGKSIAAAIRALKVGERGDV